MFSFPPKMQKLIRELSKLPSVGEKSATRLAYFLVNGDKGNAKVLADSICEAVNSLMMCEKCFFLSENKLCAVCASGSREAGLICVVEKPMDLVAIERLSEFRGLYHVLHGLWAPLKGQGPENMKSKELLERIKGGEVREVILALSSTVEGDATALYLSRLIQDLGVKTSRLAQGMPRGGELEYADDFTLSRAFQGRITL